MFLDHANDAIASAREVHTVVYENDTVRVLNIRIPSGYKTAMHWHPRSMAYILGGSKVRYTLTSGEVIDVELSPGLILEQAEGEHKGENTGFGEVKVLLVEFKK